MKFHIRYFRFLYFIFKNKNIPYNLGDFIRSRRYRENGWRNDKNYTTKFLKKYPKSICDEYYNLNKNDKQNKIKYYDDKNINFNLLNNIIQERLQNNNIKKTDHIYIHLRIGDVIDKITSPIKNRSKDLDYTEYLLKQQTHWNGVNYVYPIKYYQDIEKKIDNKIGKKNKIIIIAYKYNKDKNSNSFKYTMAIYKFFKDKEYNVDISYEENPDIEFIKLCNSKYFIKSLGGFSYLIDKIRKINNEVIF